MRLAGPFVDGEWVTAQSLAVGPDRAVWVGGDGSVSRFNGEQLATWTVDATDGLPYGEVRALAVEVGDVWAATPNGVAHFDGDAWGRFTIDDGLPTSSVTTVPSARAARVGGHQAGPGPFRRPAVGPRRQRRGPLTFDGDPSVAREAVAALITGDDGTVWGVTE